MDHIRIYKNKGPTQNQNLVPMQALTTSQNEQLIKASRAKRQGTKQSTNDGHAIRPMAEGPPWLLWPSSSIDRYSQYPKVEIVR